MLFIAIIIVIIIIVALRFFVKLLVFLLIFFLMVEELIGNFNFEIQSDDLPIIEPDNEGNEQMDQEINDEIDVSEILNPNRHKGKGS
ncbi:hypothetical protein RclHR1_01370021 [Rhizophagus clarus]|uniref:Uncharacterized protein n=1 Tax=Rhizophagus clarus TaxID=94130 RepID=A0A2Z6QF92_9GLOM|nr:hypothetical protein RclHR1_01370021 [Rhizophagus clarus]